MSISKLILTFSFPLLSFCQLVLAEEDRSSYKKIKYETSLHYNLLAGKEWWSKIEPHNLYLGGLPLNDQGHIEQIKALGVTRIISLVEPFELEDGWWHQPVKHYQWESQKVLVKHIHAVDFFPLTPRELEEGLEALTKYLAEGHTVYIHCKAGVGRSASIVVAYLMKHHHLSIDDAIAFVKKRRPHISINAAQRTAISNYFNSNIDAREYFIVSDESYLTQTQAITEEKLAQVLNEMLFYVIEGVTYESNQYPTPEFMAGWLPGIRIESTLSRRNRYLRQYKGNQNAAVQAAIEKNHSLYRKWKNILSGAIPFIGTPTNYTITLWHQMREVALIAAIYGHELNDATKNKILASLLLGNAMKIPAHSVDIVAKHIIKSILAQTGLKCIPGVSLPAHLLFNYFTDNSAKVSTYALESFGGDNAFPVMPEDYSIN